MDQFLTHNRFPATLWMFTHHRRFTRAPAVSCFVLFGWFRVPQLGLGLLTLIVMLSLFIVCLS